jgi:mRNA interferase MazF
MTLQRGGVVIVRFPFASGTAAKGRPAVVVQSDRNNARLDNVILAAITTTTHRGKEPTQVLVELTTPAGRQSGLLNDSVVSCENLATVEQSLIQRTIGALPPSLMRQVDEALKASLGLT